MTREKIVVKRKTIDQFLFYVSPISIEFGQKQPFDFHLYLEKGSQVLGKISETIFGTKETYTFEGVHTQRFRKANEKSSLYQWSIYRCMQNEQQEFIEGTSFDIKALYQEYLEEIDRIQADLYRIYQEKEKKSDLQEIWRDLRNDMTKSNRQISCVFLNLKATINFKFQIKSDLDLRFEKWEEEREKKRMSRKTLISRKGSLESRNKLSESSSLLELKEKINQSSQESIQNIRQQTTPQPDGLDKNQQNEELQHSNHSEIRITDEQGTNVTGQISKKVGNQKRVKNEDFYCYKKSSILSDIIEQSYEGSSNVNFTKSNQGENMKSVDQRTDEEEPLVFSPYVKTQNYDPHKNEESFNEIKRTATLFSKPSQQFEVEQTHKATIKNSHQYFPTLSNRSSIKKSKKTTQETIHESESKRERRSTQSEEDQKEVVIDYGEARKTTIKNVIKIVVVLVLLMLLAHKLNIFDLGSKVSKEKGKGSRQQHKTNKKIEEPIKQGKEGKEGSTPKRESAARSKVSK